MNSIFAPLALLENGWATDVRIVIDDEGKISAIETGKPPASKDLQLHKRVLLPALANLHSHAFQRAMAGMAEAPAAGQDDFWQWRKVMYQFLDVLEPADIQAIAAQAYLEMLESGYAAVAEFHYLHHQPGGQAYDDVAELSLHIMQAAQQTGIGLTHLPVLYSYAGANDRPLQDNQRRFGNDSERFAQIIANCQRALRDAPPDYGLGVAPHSLRACSPGQLNTIASLLDTGPVHIHIAEQVREVAEIERALGARPVQWLLDHVDVDPRWCLIHATHMTETEISAAAATGAVAGLCPITEANLGDGIFPARAWRAAGGRYGIGTDSNVAIATSNELCLLEYSQRLAHRSRNVLSDPGSSTGATMYQHALQGGAQALARHSGLIQVGAWADLVAIDRSDDRLCALTDEQIIDGWIFTTSNNPVSDVWSAGRHQVREGKHIARQSISARYQSTMNRIMRAL